MSLTVARVRRLIRAEGLPSAVGVEQALLRCHDESEVRGRALALRFSLLRPGAAPRLGDGAGASASWLERYDTWERGRPDVWLDEAERLGLDVTKWLGVHESLLELVGRTLRRCLEMDLRAQPAQLSQALENLPTLAATVCEAAPHAVLAGAQARLLVHSNPAQLTHFCRIWPEDDSMAPLREAYMALLEAAGAGGEPVRSVVGCVGVMLEGAQEARRALYDWDAIEQAQPKGERTLALVCGLRVPVESEDGPLRVRFSAFELIEREKPEPHLVIAPEPPDVPFECPEVEALDKGWLGPLFPSVDRVLLVLGRAVLGARCPRRGGWLPPVLVAPFEGVPLPSAGLSAISQEVIDKTCGHAAVIGATEVQLRQLMALFWLISGSEQQAALQSCRERLSNLGASDPPHRWVAAWTAAIYAVCLWRWRAGLLALMRLLPECSKMAQTRDLPEVARVWLGLPPPGPSPLGRRRRPDGSGGHAMGVVMPSGGANDERYNSFDIDLLGGLDDIELFHICLSASIHPAELLTWGLNDWLVARRLVELLATRASGGEASEHRDLRAHGSSVWVHHMLLDRDGRTLDAFKRTVSKEGMTPWSLSELDEAVELARPICTPRRAFRMSLADRAHELPSRPWPAARCWSEVGRSLGWLVAWARGERSQDGRQA